MKERSNKKGKINKFGDLKCHKQIGKLPIIVWEYLIRQKLSMEKMIKQREF